MNPPKEVKPLVERFDRNKDFYAFRGIDETSEQEKVFQRQIDATDKQIDQLVYELYGLTEEKIKIVEGSA